MKIKLFEDFNNESILFIVDVQKSFRKFFNEKYLYELNKYCQEFSKVYQIWDNHIDGKSVDKDYLYDENPDIPVHSDLYHFPNQVDLIEKRYNYNVNIDFYKKVLDNETYKKVKDLEINKKLKRGDYFDTKEGTIIVYIGNNHKWYHCPKKLFNILTELSGRKIIMVGGSDSECFLDIETTAISLGVKIKRDYKFIYSASHCPIK
jgi:hypothetical protein